MVIMIYFIVSLRAFQQQIMIVTFLYENKNNKTYATSLYGLNVKKVCIV